VEELIASLHTTALQQQAAIVHLRHQRQQEKFQVATRERMEEQRREEVAVEEVMRVLSVLPLVVSETLRHAAEALVSQQQQGEHAQPSSPPQHQSSSWKKSTRKEAPQHQQQQQQQQQQQSSYEDLVRDHLAAAILSDEVRAECETLVSLLLGGGSGTGGGVAAAPPTESRSELVEEDEAEAIAAAAAIVSKETTMASVIQLLRRYAAFTATFVWEAAQLNELRVCLKGGAASSSLPGFLVAEGGKKKEKKSAQNSHSRPGYRGGAAAGQAARVVLACGEYLCEAAHRSVRR